MLKTVLKIERYLLHYSTTIIMHVFLKIYQIAQTIVSLACGEPSKILYNSMNCDVHGIYMHVCDCTFLFPF